MNGQDMLNVSVLITPEDKTIFIRSAELPMTQATIDWLAKLAAAGFGFVENQNPPAPPVPGILLQ